MHQVLQEAGCLHWCLKNSGHPRRSVSRLRCTFCRGASVAGGSFLMVRFWRVTAYLGITEDTRPRFCAGTSTLYLIPSSRMQLELIRGRCKIGWFSNRKWTVPSAKETGIEREPADSKSFPVIPLSSWVSRWLEVILVVHCTSQWAWWLRLLSHQAATHEPKSFGKSSKAKCLTRWLFPISRLLRPDKARFNSVWLKTGFIFFLFKTNIDLGCGFTLPPDLYLCTLCICKHHFMTFVYSMRAAIVHDFTTPGAFCWVDSSGYCIYPM